MDLADSGFSGVFHEAIHISRDDIGQTLWTRIGERLWGISLQTIAHDPHP